MPAATKNLSDGFAPLRLPIFAMIWGATVLDYTGNYLESTASSWIVTELSALPSSVAAIQAVTALPGFLFAIFAGVLSDILDRRRLLIALQFGLVLVSGTLTVLAHAKALTVPSLIALTFAGGLGESLGGASWQAIVPELVPIQNLRSGIALNSLGVNIARVIGPTLAGILLFTWGATSAYALNVVSDFVVIAALLRWHRAKPPQDVVPEKFAGALRAGLRFAKSSDDLHIVLARTAVFFFFASAVWALLPLLARKALHGGPGLYGSLLGTIGAGAIAGALLLPRLRARMTADGLMLIASAAASLVMIVLAIVSDKALALVLLPILGAAWIAALTSLNSVAQSILPNWVRGRGLAIYLTAFHGAMAVGSFSWGLVANALTLESALLISGAGLGITAGALYWMRLPVGELDITVSSHWPEPQLAEPVAHDRGPVLVTVQYRISKESREGFLRAMAGIAMMRLREGAYNWGITEDASDPEHVVEWFLIESWAEHLRQHQRVSRADTELQKEAAKFHIGESLPHVTHLITLTCSRTDLMPG
jgi:MFS family permease